jgi:hypothetical protein
MESEATCRGTVYPWQCDFSDAIRETAEIHLAVLEPAGV